ncbi:carboxypeptidase regulatory-like domain-containing protein [Chloracidobacterium validum]|uniref:Carboxypeptidase regulatory-like domain-containing protein n=1 Tax=Chloracidobacterium validum TaxID=2821543 RepID=A0ABX8B8F5_9BACT|nr:carboxypeptidase-like regulatory domain-containing protein [Chloracidobacterium validum]QUW03219.1 carboxypeptidase regulatory-like domain-containing protein [Chloracidobacterium validum]
MFLWLSTLTGWAQTNAAQISGTVLDTSGAVIGGATISIQDAGVGFERRVVTNEAGYFSVSPLRPAVYRIRVTQAGFRPAEARVELAVGQVRSVEFKLEVGGSEEVVNVTASIEGSATIDLSSNRLGVNVTAREVKELPVNGRNFSQLQLLTPGATNIGVGNFNEVRFNGRSNQQNQTRLDGVDATAIFDNSPGYLTVQGSQFRLQTSLETVQEFRVESSNYPAEYGTGTGGQINVIGKSGTNEFHGAVFHYLRNDALDARNFFDGRNKSRLRLNQFGGSLGGRMIKDRLFFFTSFEGLRQRAGFNLTELTPSMPARDFVNLIRPGTTADQTPSWTAAAITLGINPDTLTAADIARINNLRLTGAMQAFPVGSGPLLDLGGVTNGGQLIQVAPVARLDENAFSVRVDGQLNGNLNGFVRFNRNAGDLASPDGASGRFLRASQAFFNVVGSLTWVSGGSLVNETKVGVNRPKTDLRASIPNVSGVTGFPLSHVLISFGGNVVSPGVNGGASTGLVSPGGLTRQSSAGNGRAQPIDPRSVSILDTVTYVRGSHTMKFGGEIRIQQVSFDQLGGTQFTFSNLNDFIRNQNVAVAFIGDLSQPGDFRILTEPLTTFSRPSSGPARARQFFIIGFAQDEWRVRQHVTLNYGLRYEYYSPVREANDRAILLDPATGQIRNPRDTALYQALKTNFAPRLGVTWAPARFKGKTVFRLGGGLFFGPGQFEDLIQPIESNVYRASQNLAEGISPTTVGLVSNTSVPVGSFTPRVYDLGGYRVPERVAQYGFSIQREVPGKTVLTVGYVGSQGRHLFLRTIGNLILPGTATIPDGSPIPAGVGIVNRVDATGRVVGVNVIRQFSIINRAFETATGQFVVNNRSVVNPFGEVDIKTSGGNDNYNALQIAASRRLTKGLMLGGQYTWSHSIGNTQGSNEAQTAQNPFDYRGERGNNTFDIRHSVNISALYELPIGKGRLIDLDGLANTLLGGFQLGGVYNGRSGVPLDIRISRPDVVIQHLTTGEVRTLPATINATTPLPAGFFAVINTPGGGASRNARRPDVVPGGNPFRRTSNNLLFINPGAFTTPRPGTHGNLARNAFYGPSFHQFDFTLQKRFAIAESFNIEFRAEVYNLFNRANVANPPVSLPASFSATFQPGTPFNPANSNLFGVVTATVGRAVGLGANRQLQFSLRINF